MRFARLIKSMRIADLDFILIPEWLADPNGREPDDDHWMSRWQRNISSASWLDTRELNAPAALLAQCDAGSRPIVVVTHGEAVEVLLDAAPELGGRPVIGAFIVAPTPGKTSFDRISLENLRLAFPSVVVAPDNHPELSSRAAEDLSQKLGGHYVAAGSTGRLDAASGHGPWPEGLLRLGWFLKRLSAH